MATVPSTFTLVYKKASSSFGTHQSHVDRCAQWQLKQFQRCGSGWWIYWESGSLNRWVDKMQHVQCFVHNLRYFCELSIPFWRLSFQGSKHLVKRLASINQPVIGRPEVFFFISSWVCKCQKQCGLQSPSFSRPTKSCHFKRYQVSW